MGDRGKTAGDALVADAAPEVPSMFGARSVRAVLALLFVVVGASLAVAVAPRIAVSLAGPGGAPDTWFAVVIPAGIILLALIGALLFRRWLWLGHKEKGLIVSALPVGVLGVAGALAIAFAAGAVVVQHRQGAGAGLFLLGSLLIAAAAVGEEVLMRGLLQPLLIRAWGAAAGIVLASLAFAAVHVIGGWINPVSLVNIFVAGLWFGLLAWRTGGFLAPSLAHVGWNWTEAMMFGADPNPGRGPYGSLWDLDLVGAGVLGGSPDGLNGSLLLTLVLAAIILPLARHLPGRRGERGGR